MTRSLNSNATITYQGLTFDPAEVEAVLMESSAIAEVALAVKEDSKGTHQLVAYIVPNLAVLGNDSLNGELRLGWQQCFDEIYEHSREQSEYDFSGWVSSFTQEPIPIEEMSEWLDQTVTRIKALGPRRVLEIGCGLGLLVERIAPQCQFYFGTDASPVAITRLQERKRSLASGGLSCEFSCRDAKDVSSLKEREFDTVVLNSVIQYFDHIQYLDEIVRNALKLVRPGGAIFIGDIRNHRLLKHFHASVIRHRYPRPTDHALLNQLAWERCLSDSELTVDPAYFDSVVRTYPGVGHVEIQLKRGSYLNELSRYRYDVTIHVEAGRRTELAFQPRTIIADEISLSGLETLLVEARPRALLIRGVPNGRLGPVASGSMGEPVSDVRSSTRQQGLQQTDPETFWALGERLGHLAEVKWSAPPRDDCFDVFFTVKRDDADIFCNWDQAGALDSNAQPLTQFANTPRASDRLSDHITQALSDLHRNLPRRPTPTCFAMLEHLPATPTGAVDRDALPGLSRLRWTPTRS